VENKVFAIDFDEKSVRVARCLNLIAGDGQTNVLHLNTLDYPKWDERIKQDEDWNDTYGPGWTKLKKLREMKGDNRNFQFDVLMANPPFAGDIKQTDMLSAYELGRKENGKLETSVGRDLLFIERNLDFLRPGGRMAIVLPQGRFNNSSDQRVRQYIGERCRILGVVGLHPNTFKPHTGTKTSVLLVQKWNDDSSDKRYHCPKLVDYPIFFATQRIEPKDTSGEKKYVKREKVRYFEKGEAKIYDADQFREKYGSDDDASFYQVKDHGEMSLTEIVSRFGVDRKVEMLKGATHLQGPTRSVEYLKDSHGHYVVQHDLFNHDGLTQDGIAEAFAEFASREKLGFF
jgi:type I restriction enzyme M protein